MFPEAPPHLFALPPGADFAREVVAGLDARMAGTPPEALARVTVLVNTRRMQRRLREVYDSGPARLTPRLRLITDLAHDPASTALPPPVAPLRRRLELTQLVARLIEREPDIAPRAALYDLSDSLAALMEEMEGEGVPPEVLSALDVADRSGHWARTLQFLTIVQRYFGETAEAPDREARQRRAVEALTRRWARQPPADPIIVAGSTASRGTTALLIEAVARLPLGAVILPGFDFDLPQRVWDGMSDALKAEDHPQYRFRRLLDHLGLPAAAVRRWTDTPAPAPERNRLVSLALRPAPVTDQWRAEGPALGPLGPATAGLTLVEASSPRAEAEAIALRLRAAVDEGITAALITPDRMLTRQVAAALDRWRIVPDDSAGVPLPLSPPGRFLRQVAGLFTRQLTGATLLSLLKHPLCHSGGTERGPHLRRTRNLELELRENGPPFPGPATILAFGDAANDNDPGLKIWTEWLADCLLDLPDAKERPLAAHLERHLKLAERLAAGPGQSGSGGLWEEAAGRTARDICDQFLRHAEVGGKMDAADYASLLDGVLRGGEVRERDRGHPQVLIWGTLEARVQGADLMILGGLNEGSWPEAPTADPWLNRAMRAEAGLLLPERRIGLSAHDWTQAIAGSEVWLTRSVRSAEAQTVPSRWLNRLTNLLNGLPETGGREALAAMRGRGERWLAEAATLSAPAGRVPPAARPAPRPPVDKRPKRLSVTAIGRLIRDPYSIYAEKVLGLYPLDPLTPSADAPLRGTILHRVFETFLSNAPDVSASGARAHLLDVAERVLDRDCPWPTVRRLWFARIERVADWFLETEVDRQAEARPKLFEALGSARLDGLDFTLTAKADRIDIGRDGRARVYDYKTGAPPTVKAQRVFEKQLLLEAALIEQGGFEMGAMPVAAAAYIGLGGQVIVPAPIDDLPPAQIWDELRTLIFGWTDPMRGYTSRRAIAKSAFAGSFDHLARFGEWDETDDPQPEDVA